MANYGKYYIAVRLLLLKQSLEANAGRNRIVKRSEREQLLPWEAQLHFLYQNKAQNAKKEAHHYSFAEQDVLPCLFIGGRGRETRPLHFEFKSGLFPLTSGFPPQPQQR
ncbi:MAG: hypothetical protein ACI3VZ_00195 [Faecousia sp.]